MLYNEAQEKFVEYMKGKQMSKETISGYEKNLNYFKRYLIAELRHASLKIEKITLQHLLSYRTYLQATRQLKPASQQRYLTAIRSFFTFLHHYEYIDNNITNKLDNIKIPRTQRAWLTIPELESPPKLDLILSNLRGSDHSKGFLILQKNSHLPKKIGVFESVRPIR